MESPVKLCDMHLPLRVCVNVCKEEPFGPGSSSVQSAFKVSLSRVHEFILRRCTVLRKYRWKYNWFPFDLNSGKIGSESGNGRVRGVGWKECSILADYLSNCSRRIPIGWTDECKTFQLKMQYPCARKVCIKTNAIQMTDIIMIVGIMKDILNARDNFALLAIYHTWNLQAVTEANNRVHLGQRWFFLHSEFT